MLFDWKNIFQNNIFINKEVESQKFYLSLSKLNPNYSIFFNLCQKCGIFLWNILKYIYLFYSSFFFQRKQYLFCFCLFAIATNVFTNYKIIQHNHLWELEEMRHTHTPSCFHFVLYISFLFMHLCFLSFLRWNDFIFSLKV